MTSTGRGGAQEGLARTGPACPHRPRLLVLRALGLGDLLTAVPALRALRRAWPGETVLAAPRWLEPTVRLTAAVDRLLPASAVDREVPERLDWPGPPPQIAVDLHGNGPLSRRLLLTARPGRLLAYAAPDGPAVWREDEHERHRWCRLLASYGIPADPDDLRIPAPARPSPAPGATVVHPGAEAAARRWPAHRFAIVARGLTRDGHEVVVTAGPGEQSVAEEVADLAGLPQSRILAAPPLDTLAALIAHARALVVGDTGPAHLATALGTPSVVLFGPVAPRLWGPPYGDPRHTAVWHPGPDDNNPRPGDAHGRRSDPRLLRVTPAEVLDAVARLPLPEPAPARP